MSKFKFADELSEYVSKTLGNQYTVKGGIFGTNEIYVIILHFRSRIGKDDY